MTNSEIVLYTTADGQIKIDTVFQNETIWLTQARMAELFDVKIPAISKHLKNILSINSGQRFETGELDEKVVVSILEHTTTHRYPSTETPLVEMEIS
ncbi:hypothetical protein ACFL5V_11900 [Fibrobacterota bacterium]